MNFPSDHNPLSQLLRDLESQNVVLGKARASYLALEASRKHEEAVLVKQAEGKSHAEKLTNAQAKPEWPLVQLKVSRAEAIYEYEKLKFSVMEKNWQSSYLEMKLDAGLIKKQE